jgi:hypothetical protein
MNFERLPNELLSGIFGYLYVIDLFQSFYGLNEHFNQLLIDFPAHRVDFRNASTLHFIEICRHPRSRTVPQVHSLVDDLGRILSRRLFSLFFREDSFPIHSSERFLPEKQDLAFQTRSM